MKKVRVKLDMKALSGLVQPMVENEVRAIQTRAGEGVKSSVSQGKTRPHGIVWTDTPEATKKNAAENTLLKAMYGGST